MRNGSTLDGIDLDGLSEEQVARLRALYAPPAGEPVTTRCAFCDFQAFGPIDEAARAFREHECDRPKVKPATRLPRFA